MYGDFWRHIGGLPRSLMRETAAEVELPNSVDPPANWSEEPRVCNMVVELANEGTADELLVRDGHRSRGRAGGTANVSASHASTAGCQGSCRLNSVMILPIEMPLCLRRSCPEMRTSDF